MRRFIVVIETGLVGGTFTDIFEVEDDATEAEIEEEAKDIFMSQCSYGYHEINENEEIEEGLE